MPLDTRSLVQDAKIELFVLDLNPIGVAQVIRFCNWSSVGGVAVSFGGFVYTPFPITSTGWEVNIQGQLPKPTVTVSNVFRDITALCLEYDDLAGAKVTRIRTFRKHLDDGSQPDPSKTAPLEIYNIRRRPSEDEQLVTFDLGSLMDSGDADLPGRTMIANICTSGYRTNECGYAGGPVADEFDRPTNDMAKDDCGLLPWSCKLRFGENGILNFAGIPGLDIIGRA